MSRKLLARGLAASLVAAAVSLSVSSRSSEAGAPPLARADAPRLPDRSHSRAVPGELLVRFGRKADAGDRSRLRERADTDLERPLPVRGLQLLSVERGQSVTRAVSELERADDVVYAEPNFYRSATIVPNDPYFGYLWGLHNNGQSVAGRTGTPDADIDAPEAWDGTTGSSAVTVAVVDSGVDQDHPDLRGSAWTNPGETGGGRESNGLDDDGDGLRDDWRGWDWVDWDNAPGDLNGHGTHVAGTVAARGNDATGVAGIAWGTRVMPLRVLDASGSGSVADLISAYRYAAAHGAKVVNASLGGPSYSQAESDAITGAPGTLFVVAAGNGGDDGVGDDNGVVSEYPCDYPASNLVCVAASDSRDALASFSNYSLVSVDLAAPGVNILSTQPGSSYAFYDGTSMATPHVSGVAALLYAAAPAAPPVDALAVKAALLGGVDAKPAFVAKTTTGGRLNAARSLAMVSPGTAGVLPPPTSSPSPAPSPTPVQSTPPPAPVSVPDTVAPSISLRARARQRLGAVLSRGLPARVGCSERCTISSHLLVDARTARRLGLTRSRRPTVVARFFGTIAPSGASVRLRLGRTAKRKLRRATRVRMTLRAVALDSAGNSSGASRRILLVR